MDYEHRDLARLEREAADGQLHLFAFVESDDPMALNSSDNWHIHAFPSYEALTTWVESAEATGFITDDTDPELWGLPEVEDILDDPDPVLDITFH